MCHIELNMEYCTQDSGQASRASQGQNSINRLNFVSESSFSKQHSKTFIHMSTKSWKNVGHATTAQYWTPSSTSVRSTIAEHAVSNKNYSPPSYLRRPFGGIDLRSTSENVYRKATQHTSFLNRTTTLRNSMSASGLSFIRDIAESIPLPKSGAPNLITRRQKRPRAVDPLETYRLAIPTSPMLTSQTNTHTTSSSVNGAGSSSRGYQSVGRPEHARRKVFIDAAFNASNFGSTGCGMASGMGVLKAQSFYVDKNRPFGDGPVLFRGEAHSVPKFTNFSTKQTMRRTFLSPPVGRKKG
jgi:hypothetical protein